MTVDHPTDPETGDTQDQQPNAARKNRGVRFSDAEWEEVRGAAQTDGITPAEFVRENILALVRNPQTTSPNPIPSHLVPLIERTFRYTHVLATKLHEDMTEGGQAEQLEKLIKEARALQDSLREHPPD